MLVEIGINTIKADYFNTVEEIDRIETICECLDIDYIVNYDSPFQRSEIRIVCNKVKAKKLLKLFNILDIHYDHYIFTNDKSFLEKGFYS